MVEEKKEKLFIFNDDLINQSLYSRSNNLCFTPSTYTNHLVFSFFQFRGKKWFFISSFSRVHGNIHV